jgi:hypothetical protein
MLRALTTVAFVAAAFVTIVDETFAAGRTNKFGTSFVDADNDGVFDPGVDVLLSSILDGDDNDFSTGAARPGYTPPPPPVGVVLEGKVTLIGNWDIDASGTVVVRGNVQAMPFDSDGGAGLDISGRALQIASKSRVTNKGDFLTIFVTDHISIGDRVRFSSVADIWLGVDGPMVLGDNIQIRTTGNKEDYSGTYLFIGTFDLQAGRNLYIRTNDYAAVDFEHNGDTNTDMVLERFRFRGGSLALLSYGHPDGNRLHVLDSYIDQRDPEGELELYAAPSPGGAFLPDALLLTGTSMRVRGSLDTTPDLP